jgi:tRNA/rRNA methyltransferase
LLTEDQCERLDVVLVSPRNPLNIGAVARAMANFGFGRLSVVAPFAPHWREARSAVGAPELLAQARETETLADAVAQCTFVAGTGTLTYRKPEQRVVSLPDLAPLVAVELARGGRIGLVFGPEKHGLTREDLSYCHVMVEIPTDTRQPSMNLGQAVAVCLYELAIRAFRKEMGQVEGGAAATESSTGESGEERASVAKANVDFVGLTRRLSPPPPSGSNSSAAPGVPSGTVDLLAGLVEQTMQAAGYSPRSMQAANRHDLRLMLRRLALTQPDARRILGLFRRVMWRLNRKPGSDDKSD